MFVNHCYRCWRQSIECYEWLRASFLFAHVKWRPRKRIFDVERNWKFGLWSFTNTMVVSAIGRIKSFKGHGWCRLLGREAKCSEYAEHSDFEKKAHDEERNRALLEIAYNKEGRPRNGIHYDEDHEAHQLTGFQRFMEIFAHNLRLHAFFHCNGSWITNIHPNEMLGCSVEDMLGAWCVQGKHPNSNR